MVRYESVIESIGGTPLIRLTRAAESLRPRIYVKPEWQNPGGSVKDRAAVSMLRRAEADGSLRPGGTVVEVTSGNTGIGLALVAAHLGYRTVIFTSSFIAQEKRSQLTAYGAELRLVDAFVPRSHPDSLLSHAQRFVAATPGAWLALQYDNPANPAAHQVGTGPEIWADTDEAVTHFVATVGTGGTISGTGRYLKEVSDGRVRVIGADPSTSAYSGGDGSQKYIEGAGHFIHPETAVDEWPGALDVGVIDQYIGVDDQRAIDAIRWFARTEGILAGGSSGVALAAALEVAKDLTEDDTVVVLLPDSGRTYLSTYFNDNWLAANGFTGPATPRRIDGPTVGDRASVPPLIERDEIVAEVVPRLAADGLGGDDVVLVVHRRDGRVQAPHPSDVLGWTTLAGLRGAATIAEVVRPAGPRLGTGLALTDPAVTAWDRADGGVALVLDGGRVTGTVTWEALDRVPAYPEAERYGDAGFVLDSDSETIRLQLRHRSVRKFRPGPVTDGQLTAIVAAAQSAPTSSNLQAWSVVAVRDPQRKARLAKLAADQRFIDEAPLLLIWLADLGRARRLAVRRDATHAGADYLETTLVAFLDTTLAAQNAIVAAESLGLGTVCVGSIRNHPIDVARELQLPPHTFAVFGLAVGIPDPSEQAGIKPRLPQSSVLHHETYATEAADDALEAYDQRLSAYHARFGGSGTWTERVLARLSGPQSMAGRHTIRGSLERLGFPSR